jgi:hypothetical protein
VQVVRQPRLFIKHLPRIPQWEIHCLQIYDLYALTH